MFLAPLTFWDSLHDREIQSGCGPWAPQTQTDITIL